MDSLAKGNPCKRMTPCKRTLPCKRFPLAKGSKSAREDAEKKLQAPKKAQSHPKNVLAKKPSLEVLKPALVKCASLCKDAKEEELKQ